MQKILIDENLSPSLTADAQQKGFLCSHVNHLGKTGTKDWELKRVILDGDWTFVTNNTTDFRGPANEPGSSGEYADVRLHAGLVCIDAPFGLNLGLQRQIFGLILDELAKNGDLVNKYCRLMCGKTAECISSALLYPRKKLTAPKRPHFIPPQCCQRVSLAPHRERSLIRV